MRNGDFLAEVFVRSNSLRPRAEERGGCATLAGPMGETTRDRILDGALTLIAERGLLAVTNRNLAEVAQVSLGSLTYHFESQEQLLRETLLRFVERETERLRLLANELNEGVEPAVLAERVQTVLSQEPERRLAKLELYLYAARRPDLQGAAARCFAAYDAVVASALTALGIDHPEIAEVAVAAIDGLQLRRLATGDPGELAAADALMLLLRGAHGAP
jgi:TetR/AcrR family transcriptional regulator, regulator of biofilm formation and stress response